MIVIPGNHDINNPQAEGFRGSETYAAEQISAEEFAEIYKQFGYREAVNRDPYSLSYVYALDEYTWIMMLDSCQYEPNHLVGGMIQEGTYQWIEENLETAWKEGIRVIPVSHHNLLEQTDTSEEFIRNCTIEHDERLIQMWEDNQITLHLSGHLHIQHFEQVEDESQLFDVVTGSLMIYPCKYGIVEVFNNGDLKYYTKKVPVAEWVKRHGKNNRELLQFDEYAKDFLYDISYERTYDYLREHGFTVPQSQMMAKLYANLNPNFYAGTIPQASEAILQDQAYVLWKESEYFSEVSTTIQMMIQEENHDFNTLYIPY